MNSDKDQIKEKGQKAGFVISVQITAIVLVIFIIASLVCLFSFQKALGNTADKSKAKVVESTAAIISSSHALITRFIISFQIDAGISSDYRQVAGELEQALAEGKENTTQKNSNDLLREMIESGSLELSLGYLTTVPGPDNNKAVIAASSDKKYIAGQVPEGIAALIDSDKGYYLFEDGIPEMGLKGRYLVTSHKLTAENSSDEVLWYFDFKPMEKLLAGIDEFYGKENRRAVLKLILVMGFSITGLIIISFMVLGYLIRKRIIEPIDELSSAAEMVIEGDTDVRLEIIKREEFSALKYAFNNMISALSEIILSGTVSMGAARGDDDNPAVKWMNKDAGSRTSLKPRSTILFQVIALFTVVFIAAGVFYMLSISGSMEYLVKKSKDTMIDTEAQLIESGWEFGSELVLLRSSAQGREYSNQLITELPAAIRSKTVSSYQQYVGDLFVSMVNNKLYGYKIIYCVVPPGLLAQDYTVIFASDDIYLYSEPPEEIEGFFDQEGNDYKFCENGIPEMGFDEPYLLTCYMVPITSVQSIKPAVIGYKPMGKEITAIDSFFAEENKNLKMIMGAVIGISIIVLIVVTALALTYLVRKQITGPIEDLVSAADEVMDGNLDVQVQIRPGEKLESLKTAFNELIKALRDIIEKSMES
ncbi:MAG: HAMP domain-containing protein [Actinobacteria bacterium]|nr:HAMP domain-containing protein [Actinomycetota bacterium]